MEGVAQALRYRRQVAVLSLALLANSNPRPLEPAAIMPTLPPAVIDDTLVIGGENIDARKVRSRMTVDVRVNGQGPYRFVVDSGADTTVVGERMARALRLPMGTPVLLNNMTDSSRVDRVLIDELQLGPSIIRELELPALKDRDLGAEGMIGLDALVEQRLMMDFEKRLISVDDARRPPRRLDGEIVVVARMRRGQLIITEASANSRQVDAVIDTGSEVTIGNHAMRDRLLRRNRNAFTTVFVTGVTGVTVEMQMTTIRELRLGGVILRNVPIAFAEVPPFAVFGLSDRPALLLGTDLMEHFRKVSLDFRARKVRFQLRKCGSNALSIRTLDYSAPRLLSADGANAVCRS